MNSTILITSSLIWLSCPSLISFLLLINFLHPSSNEVFITSVSLLSLSFLLSAFIFYCTPFAVTVHEFGHALHICFNYKKLFLDIDNPDLYIRLLNTKQKSKKGKTFSTIYSNLNPSIPIHSSFICENALSGTVFFTIFTLVQFFIPTILFMLLNHSIACFLFGLGFSLIIYEMLSFFYPRTAKSNAIKRHKDVDTNTNSTFKRIPQSSVMYNHFDASNNIVSPVICNKYFISNIKEPLASERPSSDKHFFSHPLDFIYLSNDYDDYFLPAINLSFLLN